MDFDGDGNVIVPSGILNEMAGGDQARIDKQLADNKAAVAAAYADTVSREQATQANTVPWERDTARADLGNVKHSKLDALRVATAQRYDEPVSVTIARASAYLDWLNT
jgi:hypothetical protein